ncbi:MAG: efflux RND transporter periplasmic adaptor subunit [Azospirillum sp.]|nr:efflux RND transporter periplasmic adaptor subunit [Azospirillum sp.]
MITRPSQLIIWEATLTLGTLAVVRAEQANRAVSGVPTGGPGRAVLAIALVAGLGLLAGCNQKNSYAPPPPPAVKVAQPLRAPVTEYLELTGNTVPINSIDLVARVEGFLRSIAVDDGDTVTKGQSLFVIEPEVYQAKLDQAKGEVEQYQATLVAAEADLTRQASLARQDFASQARLDEARAKRDEARAGLTQANASLRLAEINLDYTTVIAPFEGRMSAHLVDIGALVGASGPTTLARLVQLDPIYVTFTVDERTVLQIREARRQAGEATVNPRTRELPVEIGLQTETGYAHRGRIDYIAPAMDSATGTLAIRAVLDNPDHRLLPGLFVRVRVPLKERQETIQVPERALGTDQSGRYLLLLGADDTVVQRPVRTGPLRGGLQVIEEGLALGDWVIVDGLQRAIPGAKVAPERTTLAPGAAATATPAAAVPAASTARQP